MNKLELIAELQKTTGLTKAQASRIVALFFSEICAALVKGDRVEIRGLCAIFIKQYEPFDGRNPNTGEPVAVKSKKLPYFRPGKELRERVDTEGSFVSPLQVPEEEVL